MPSIAAAIIASLAGWVIDATIEPFMGIGARLLIGLIASSLVYLYARRWLVNLRNGL